MRKPSIPRALARTATTVALAGAVTVPALGSTSAFAQTNGIGSAARPAASSTAYGSGSVHPAWSGGGCAQASGGGFTASACISGSGLSSISDAYVTRVSGCYTLDIIQYNNRSAVMGAREYRNRCRTGHFDGPRYSGLRYFGPFETKVVISRNGIQRLVVWSPDLHS